MPNPVTDHDIIVQYNRENGTNFYNIKQVNEDKLKKAETHKVWANDDETVGSSRFRATIAAAHNAPTQKQATKIALDAAKQRGVETAAMAAVAAAPYVLPVIANPVTASTTAGAVAATGLDASGLAMGLNQLNNYWNNRKNLTWKDTPGILLSGLSLVPGSSQLTNVKNLGIAANTFRTYRDMSKLMLTPQYFKVLPKNTKSLIETYTNKKGLQKIVDDTYNTIGSRASQMVKSAGDSVTDVGLQVGLPENSILFSPKFGTVKIDFTNNNAAELLNTKPISKRVNYIFNELSPDVNMAEATADGITVNRAHFLFPFKDSQGNWQMLNVGQYKGTAKSILGHEAGHVGMYQISPIRNQNWFKLNADGTININNKLFQNGDFAELVAKSGHHDGLPEEYLSDYFGELARRGLPQSTEWNSLSEQVKNSIIKNISSQRGLSFNSTKNLLNGLSDYGYIGDGTGVMKKLKYESPVTEEISIVPQNEFMSTKQVVSGSRPISEAERLGIPKGERKNLTLDQIDALSDLYWWKTQGRFKRKFGFDPTTDTFRWSSKLSDTEVPGVKAIIDAGGTASHIDGPITLSNTYGNFTVWPGKNAKFSANFPIPEGMKWGPGDTTTMLVDNSGHEMKFILTSPKVDAIDSNLPQTIIDKLSDTIDKYIMKRYWTMNRQMIRPGTYLSGDNGGSPLGAHAMRTFDSSKNIDSAISDILYFKSGLRDVKRTGLSPDSWSALVRQGSRPGMELRWGSSFQKWNPSAVKNKSIYDGWVKMKNGEITPEEYKKIFDAWSLPQGGRPLEIIKKPSKVQTITDNNGIMKKITTQPQVYVNIPHPYILYKKQGGVLKGRNGLFNWLRSKSMEKIPTSNEELDPAVITASPQTSSGRIKMLRSKIRDARKRYREFDRNLRNYDYIPDQTTFDNLADELKNIPDIDILKDNIRYELDKKRSNSFLGFSSNALPTQLYRWWSRHWGYGHRTNGTLSGRGTDIIDLDKNVVRLTPGSKQSTALFNEYVESNKPSVNPASKYQSGEISYFGDLFNIPVDNISLYAGIENGHYKVDSLKNFNPNTTVYPARNVKSNVLPIKKININLDNTNYNNFENTNRRTFQRKIKMSEKSPVNGRNSSLLALRYPQSNPELNQKLKETLKDKYDLAKTAYKEGNYDNAASILGLDNLGFTPNRKLIRKALFQFKNPIRRQTFTNYYYFPVWVRSAISDVYGKLNEENKVRKVDNKLWTKNNETKQAYTYTDINGAVRPISEWNAKILDNKMVFGNPNGGKFVGRIQDISQPQLDSLNSWLAKNPSWLVTPDLGSFSQYRLDNPTLKEYLKQYFEHPDPEDPNVYTVGTTEPNEAFK